MKNKIKKGLLNIFFHKNPSIIFPCGFNKIQLVNLKISKKLQFLINAFIQFSTKELELKNFPVCKKIYDIFTFWKILNYIFWKFTINFILIFINKYSRCSVIDFDWGNKIYSLYISNSPVLLCSLRCKKANLPYLIVLI